MSQFGALLHRFQFPPLALGNVNCATDEPEKLAVGFRARHSMIQDPTIFTVESPQAVFHCKLLPRVKSVSVDFKTAIEIFAVHALRPPITQALFQRTAGKVEPAFVEKGTELVSA